ncbi:TetR family transcriptional regulator [Kineococcus sp. R8]|uniref:TetR/AcrR family transcriptional regulator n=1 Tax=Kineococcus siccus TaxID=2696567 RepID=UPI0014132421|nr:TetR/AcrR family transcriptional regulator [Kineococcus siccus]NAZ84004.1 TetR family transcriptional regulator [Kineococcus siccus]
MANAQRRAALLDAAIEVLAAQGARGLTFRAVDAEASVPAGTTSNYFASRDELLTQAGGRIYQRLAPDAATVARGLAEPRDHDRVVELVHQLTERITAYRSGHLALLELRLEATRRPALRHVLTATVLTDLRAVISYHLDTGLPGNATTAVLLYLAVNWLVLEQLTLPDVLLEVAGSDFDHLVTTVVQHVLHGAAAQMPSRSEASPQT